MSITITVANKQVSVLSPYNPDFPKRARNLGGSWNGTAWTFDARDEDRVRDLCREIYGEDGRPTERVDVQVSITSEHLDGKECYLAGRQVARVFDRDGGARLGDGVVVLSGKFHSTGSRKHPAIGAAEDTVIELRDVPKDIAMTLEGATIVCQTPPEAPTSAEELVAAIGEALGVDTASLPDAQVLAALEIARKALGQ